MSKIRATKLPGSKDMKMPEPVQVREEIKIQVRSQSYMEALSNFMCDQCDEKGELKDGDVLSHEERAGLEEIREGIKTKNWMI